MNTYQKRIQASMEKLNVPTWYKSSSSNTTAPPTPTPTLRPPSKSSTLPSFTSSWRTASLSTQAGWRRQNPPLSSSISSAASTLDRQSCLVTSQRFRNKVSTLPSSSSANNLLPNKVYLGWRSQERLDIGPLYLTSPAQRLATSTVVVKEKPAKNEVWAITSACCLFHIDINGCLWGRGISMFTLPILLEKCHVTIAHNGLMPHRACLQFSYPIWPPFNLLTLRHQHSTFRACV